jgi:hypothetical protein
LPTNASGAAPVAAADRAEWRESCSVVALPRGGWRRAVLIGTAVCSFLPASRPDPGMYAYLGRLAEHHEARFHALLGYFRAHLVVRVCTP